MSARAGCPAAEELAATVDGTAAPAVRDRVLEHVNGCEDCYLVFTETARFADGTAHAAGRPVTRPRQLWRPVVILPLAAAAALMVVAYEPSARPVAQASPPPPVTPSAFPRATTLQPTAAPSSPSTRPPALLAEPPWLASARWRDTSRLAFAPDTPARRATLLGLHAAAVEELCRAHGAEAARTLIGEVLASAERGALVEAGAARAAAAAAAAGECPRLGSSTRVAHFRLGRAAEAWRIDAALGRPASLDPARGRELMKLAAAAGAPEAVTKIAARLEEQAAAGDRDALVETLDDLVEVLCA